MDLNSLIFNDTITSSEIAEQFERMKKLGSIKQEYENKIKKRKDGRVYVYVDRKQYVAATPEELYKKLYDKLYGVETWNMQQLFPDFLKWKNEMSAVKGATLRRYVYLWNKHLKNASISETEIRYLKPKDFINLFSKWTSNREMTSKEFVNTKSIINGIYEYAINELEIVQHNVAKDVSSKRFPFKQVNNDGEVFSLADRESLLNHLQNNDSNYALAIRFAFYIPIRIGELTALKWSDIDGNKLRIKRQRTESCEMNDDLTFTPREYKISNQTKGFAEQGIRYVFLGEKALDILSKVKKTNELIFTNKKGQPLYQQSFNRNLKKFCKEINVTPRSSHKIRFCVASMYYEKGVPITEIQRMLGHTTVQMTMHYLRDVMTDKATEKIISNLE